MMWPSGWGKAGAPYKMPHPPSLIRVLFVCVHNSARSQMAEAFLNRLGAGRFYAESAGLEPGRLNPVVVSAMKEIGFDISRHAVKSVASVIQAKRPFDYVITVCDEASAEKCPVFPGQVKRLHWSFADPSQLTGTPEEKFKAAGVIRDQIQKRITDWINAFPR